MNLEDKVQKVIERFNQYKDWEDRYKELIKFGKESKEYSCDDQVEKYQVKGCQSQVWLKPQYENGRVVFTSDSDAMLVKGIVGVLTYVYSDATPDEILALEPDFLKQIGITEHLSMNRTNGLASMLKQIKM